MLEDVQERLVYRTHIYIRSDILNYNPAAGDLAYPEKLEMMESIAESLKQANPTHQQHSRSGSNVSASSIEVAQITANGNSGEKDQDVAGNEATTVENGRPPPLKLNIGIADPQSASNMPMSPADLHGMWYPTVRRTLVCLSKLFRCIDKTTFQGLSQETLSMCIQSLLLAAEGIKKRKDTVHAELFLIKHLLILREQISPFHVDFAIRETALDFSKIKDAAYGLYQHKSKLFTMNSNNALLQFIVEGTPQVTEYLVDSKRDVDNQLKKTCEDFIKNVTQSVIGPCQSFLVKADVIVKMNKDEADPHQVSLRQQPFANPEKVQELVTQTYKNVKSKVPGVQKGMSLYLSNKDTEYILFKPIKLNIQQAFQKLIQIISENYTEEEQQIIGCPSVEQINLHLKSSN